MLADKEAERGDYGKDFRAGALNSQVLGPAVYKSEQRGHTEQDRKTDSANVSAPEAHRARR